MSMPTNGGPVGAPDPGAAMQPQMNVLAQYTKDFSFENPNAPQSFQMQQQPALNIQINVNAQPLGQTDFEISLLIEGKAELMGSIVFGFDLNYCGIFRLQNIPQDNMHPLLMIECPRLLFPFAREIIAKAVRDGGFPPLHIDPIDFVALYRQKMAEGQMAMPPSMPS